MSGFRNILVGVDLTSSASLPNAPLDRVAQTTIRNARWVARAGGAKLTYLSVLGHAEGANQAARKALDELVRAARAEGIEAEGVQRIGHGWIEIIRKVVQDDHDLLIVGTHDPHGLRRLLLGSTARKLLHECPCPVWVSKPGPAATPRNILVASDLSPLSDLAARVGLVLGHLADAHTHLLDVVEYPLDRLWGPYPADPVSKQYHARIHAAANVALHAQVERSGRPAAAPSVTVHVADSDGLPDHAIVNFIQEHDIDLLILGSAARHGLAAVVLGNTAERLLPEVRCSVLVVKPTDFHCVVPADGH